jgi:ice-binding like protein
MRTLTSTTPLARSMLRLATASCAALLAAAPFQAALAQSAPALGSAAGFAILSGAGVTLTGSAVTGDVGTYALVGAVTQTSSPVIGAIHLSDSTAVAASTDFLAAYAALAALPPNQCDVYLTGTLAGVTLPPGNYCFNAAATLTGVLTLDGPADATWLFRIGTSGAGALTGTSFAVVMSGGASACNVTWQVADAVTMTTSDFQGSILAGAAITFTGGSLVGRDLAKAGVTLTGSAITGCTSASQAAQ